MRVALIHDWLVSYRGGEQVLDELISLFPNADLKILFGRPDILKNNHLLRHVETSYLNTLPMVERYYPYLLPLFPHAIETFDLTGYDLIISSSHCVAKGVLSSFQTRHICYLHSPMRYIWDQTFTYFSPPKHITHMLSIVRQALLSSLRVWDVASAHRVHVWIPNSQTIKKRLENVYPLSNKPIHPIYPPVDWEKFFDAEKWNLSAFPSKPTLILWGAWVPYKKIAWAVETLWPSSDYHLIVCGQGPEKKQLQKIYNQHPFEWYEAPSFEQLKDCIRRSHIFVFPGFEDFGISVVEAFASGLHVIHPDCGGAQEIASFFPGRHQSFEFQNPKSLKEAINKVLKAPIHRPESIESIHALFQPFSKERFHTEIRSIIEQYTGGNHAN